MNVSLMPVRPPYVTFELRAVEDRDASIAAGGMVYKDVAFAIISQPGGKDTHEQVAAEWLAEIKRQVQLRNYPIAWVDHFERLFKAFQEGQEAPLNGTSVLQWPKCTPATAKMFTNHGLRCIEDVAAMTEDLIRKVGPGAREWKRDAQNYLDNREQNKAAEQVSALQAALDAKDVRIASLEDRLAALESGEKPKRKKTGTDEA